MYTTIHLPRFENLTMVLITILVRDINFFCVNGECACCRLFNGCKIPLNSLPSETLLNGRKNVTLRDNLTVLCPILVPETLENCLEKPFDYTLAWNVPIIILGSWIPLAMVSPSNNYSKTKHKNKFEKSLLLILSAL